MNQQPLFKKFKAIALFGVVILGASLPSRAADVFFFESFENYNLGPLDADLNGGTNSFPDGGAYVRGAFFNPWWGSEPPNLIVVGPENGVTPHSGNQMVRGSSTNFMTVSQDLYNIGYRANHGVPFRGNLVLDWWFYDPIGNSPSSPNYQDSLSLFYNSDLPSATDYNDTFFSLGATGQLALGAANGALTGLNSGFDSTKYQALISGAKGYDGAGWFNTATIRSLGWHHARITMSAVLPTGSAFIFFYIDDLAHATLNNNVTIGSGVNGIEMDAGFGNTTGYFDDISLDLSQHAQLTMTKSKTNLVLRWPAGWSLQSSTSGLGTNFVDVTGATSPYTNNYSPTTQLYRLRSGN